MLDKRELIPEKYQTNKHLKAETNIDPKYSFLREGHSNPRKVDTHDLETDKVDLYPSIYKAALALDQIPGVIGMCNVRVWRKGTRSKC